MKKFLSIALVVIMCTTTFILSPKANATQNPVGAGRVTTSGTALNVRSSPNLNATVKAKLSRNSYVTLLSESNGFWYVRYNHNGYGYCHKDYIYKASSDVRYIKTTSGNLRIRAGAGTNYTVLTSLPSGTPVTVLSTTGDYARVVYNGNKTGYASTKYLTKIQPATTYKAVNLSVPNYKQTDSRWANVTLGNSGQTISKIGCATTALAMTESYRTGKTIYPDAMSKKLSYTSGGAVYWPTNYNITTSSSGYLQKVHSALQSGKPVIIGAKKANGTQHYVVVTGFNGGNTLSTAQFLINDPGSKTRTTLSQFLASYPYFYKMLIAK